MDDIEHKVDEMGKPQHKCYIRTSMEDYYIKWSHVCFVDLTKSTWNIPKGSPVLKLILSKVKEEKS